MAVASGESSTATVSIAPVHTVEAPVPPSTTVTLAPARAAASAAAVPATPEPTTPNTAGRRCCAVASGHDKGNGFVINAAAGARQLR